MTSLSLAFDILARDKASDAFESAGRSAGELGDKTSKMSGQMKAAMAGAAIAVAGFAVQLGGDAIDAAKESMKVAAQTEAALKSTGAQAWVSSDQIGELAHSLQNLSGVSDETIQSGQNMLLTFTNIRNEAGKGNDIFDQATKAMLDYSVATGTDATSASVTLGKALNDPIAGLSALGRAGVQFTDVQKASIETMVASGDIMGAQKIILAELSTQFGGSAAAAGEAMTAGERLSMKWGDMQEQLGTWLIPKMNALIEGLMSTADWIGRNKDVVVPLAAAFGGLTVAVVAITTAAKAYAAVQAALNIVMALNPVGAVILAIAALTAGLVVAYQKSETFRDVVDSSFRVVKRAAEIYLTPIRALLEVVIDAAGATGRAFERLSSTVSSKASEVVAFFRALPGQIVSAIGAVGNAMFRVGERIIEGLVNGVKSRAGDAADVVKDVVGGAIDAGKFVLGIRSPSRVFFQIGEYTMEGFVDGLEAGVGPLNQAIDTIFGGLSGQVSDILSGFGAMDTRAAAQDRLQEARDKLAAVSVPGAATDDVIRAAQKDVTEATLRAVAAEQAYVAAQQKMLESGPDGIEFFEELAAAAGLSEQEITRLWGSIKSFQSGVGGLTVGARGPNELPAEVARYLEDLYQHSLIQEDDPRWDWRTMGNGRASAEIEHAAAIANPDVAAYLEGLYQQQQAVNVTINAPSTDPHAIANATRLALRMV